MYVNQPNYCPKHKVNRPKTVLISSSISTTSRFIYEGRLNVVQTKATCFSTSSRCAKRKDLDCERKDLLSLNRGSMTLNLYWSLLRAKQFTITQWGQQGVERHKSSPFPGSHSITDSFLQIIPKYPPNQSLFMRLDCQVSPFHLLDGVNMCDNEWRNQMEGGDHTSYLSFSPQARFFAEFVYTQKAQDCNKINLPIFHKYSQFFGDAGNKHEVWR